MVLTGGSQPLLRLGLALFFAQSAFAVYNAAIPLYFAGLGFDPTLIGLLIGGTGLAYFSVAFAIGMLLGASGGGLLYPFLGFHGLLQVGALLCGLGIVALLRDRVTMRLAPPIGTSRTYAGPG